jgi:hypothetical protein
VKTFATMFSGGELVGMGARAAGLLHTWGIEHDAAIASVAHANGWRGHFTFGALCAGGHWHEQPRLILLRPLPLAR